MINMLAIDVKERILELQNFKTVTFCAYEEVKNDSTVEALAVSIYQTIDEALLKRLPNLRYIFVLGTSDKNIDTVFCEKHGIKILVVKHYCDQETAEWVMLEILKFFRERAQPVSVTGKRLGIIGLGDVGARLLNLAQSFSMEILVNTKSEQKLYQGKLSSKAEIFATCDIISFHTPANTPWLTKDLYELAKPGQGWINTCMGEISLEPDLDDFLAEGRVSLIMDSIAGKSHQHLASLAKIYTQPAFNTLDSQKRLKEKFLANIKHILPSMAC